MGESKLSASISPLTSNSSLRSIRLPHVVQEQKKNKKKNSTMNIMELRFSSYFCNIFALALSLQSPSSFLVFPLPSFLIPLSLFLLPSFYFFSFALFGHNQTLCSLSRFPPPFSLPILLLFSFSLRLFLPHTYSKSSNLS